MGSLAIMGLSIWGRFSSMVNACSLYSLNPVLHRHLKMASRQALEDRFGAEFFRAISCTATFEWRIDFFVMLSPMII